ncbi:glycoside hydrolase family 127 protein [bacterium]|nr:MAG: glycoside hydrolase family 127 protein [bacterium]
MAFTRRLLIKGLSAAGIASFVPSSFAAFAPNVRFPMTGTMDLHPLTAVPIERVVIDDAFWTPKRDIWRSVTLWDCFRKFEEQGDGSFHNFDRVRDGLKGGHSGNPWQDGLVYEMIRGASDFLRSQPDSELEAKLDGYIERIVAAQEPGGYLNTYTQLMEPDHRWGLNGGMERWQHEFYNLGAMVEAGVHYYRATGKTALLEAGVKAANLMVRATSPSEKTTLVPSHELPEEAVHELYLLIEEQPELKGRLETPVDEASYRTLAERWIEARGLHVGAPDWEANGAKAEAFVREYRDYEEGRPSWGAYAQDDKPVFEQPAIEGHAVRATLLCSVIAAVARTNDRPEYRETAQRLWESMVFRRMHITGGVGAYADDEKFGPDYTLPNDAYLETCAAVGAGFFHQNMALTFGHARYADELERVLYNGVLCGISLTGEQYTYQNPLVVDEKWERWHWHDCPCCPPMFLKIMGAMPGTIYATDADSAYVNLYVGGHGAMTVKGTEIVLRQKTEYPWKGAVRISVEPESKTEFGLMLRIPAWSQNATVKVNGEEVSTSDRVRGYLRIERVWQKGDTVEVEMPMPVQAVHAHPEVKENVGRAAMMRGPLVYCFESTDNPARPEALRLDRKPAFSTEPWTDRLGGIVAVKSEGLVAIPFYANGNRGPVSMAVWLSQETPNQ